MHYPKVLERVDFPEQIFHRSYSLGAPELIQISRSMYTDRQTEKTKNL